MRALTPSMILLIAAPLSLAACGEAPDEASCAAICAKAADSAHGDAAPALAPDAPAKEADAGDKGPRLTAFEAQILANVLEDVKFGVRPFDDSAVGICKGQGKECETFLGADAGTLEPGKYMLRAELTVPNIGPRGTWKIVLATQCTTTFTAENGDVRTTEQNRSRDYDVSYAGEQRGYRLSPLMKIDSPSAAGEEVCKWTITAPHGDGDKVYSGSWTVPQG